MNKERIASVDEFDGDGSQVIREVKGREIAVFALDGEYRGVLNWCCHAGGPLCEGEVKDEVTVDDDGWWRYDRSTNNIECPWHCWKFDIETGENTRTPKYSVPVYDIVEEDGELFVTW